MTTTDLAAWIGRREAVEDPLPPFPARALAATLDRSDLRVEAGDPLPPAWHWIHFLSAAPTADLDADGHPARGGFLPPVALPRRMWAGGRLRLLAPLRLGRPARRESEVVSIEDKAGRSGRLVFVLVRHRVTGSDGLAIEEEQDLVYREAPRPDAAPLPAPPAPAPGPWRREIKPDPVLLFRYSALTFNGHRIHYDHPYVTGVEGYPGLVVHGPLIATLLLDLVGRQAPERRVIDFSFRAQSPLFCDRPFTVNGRPMAEGGGAELWAATAEGGLAMSATVRFA